MHFKGTGVGQLVAVFCICSYYASLMALIGSYLFDSFKTPLPWSQCRPEWKYCIDSAGNVSTIFSADQKLSSSSELYYR